MVVFGRHYFQARFHNHYFQARLCNFRTSSNYVVSNIFIEMPLKLDENSLRKKSKVTVIFKNEHFDNIGFTLVLPGSHC